MQKSLFKKKKKKKKEEEEEEREKESSDTWDGRKTEAMGWGRKRASAEMRGKREWDCERQRA